MKIIEYYDASEKFEKFIFENARSPLYSSLNVLYSAEYENTAKFVNLSFGIQFKEELLSVFILFLKSDSFGNDFFDGCGRPALFTTKSNLDDKEIKTIKTLIRDRLNQLFIKYPNAITRYYETLEENGGLSLPSIFLLENGAKIKYELSSEIDLRQALPKLLSEVRKSYKSLINWGTKNLQLRILDYTTIQSEDICMFRELHIQVAGKETRSKKTWDLMFDMIKANEAFMIDGFWEGQYVTASFFIFNKNYCYYGVSASVRELFDKPLLHASMWKAIEFAKNKEISFFEIGSQVFTGFEGVSKKEIDISTFKRGFGGFIKMKAVLEK